MKNFNFMNRVCGFVKGVKDKVTGFCDKLVNKAFDALCSLVNTVVIAVSSPRFAVVAAFFFILGSVAVAQDYSSGTTALTNVSTEIAKYVPIVVKLCYAIAGVVAVVGAISVYIKMNNEEQDVKKSIMMIVGACIFLIAAAQALPLFFGIEDAASAAP